MKKITLSLFLAFASVAAFSQAPNSASAASQVQDNKSVQERAEEITMSMAKHLHLTPEQIKKLNKINLRSMQTAEEVKEKYKAEPREMVKQMDIISQTRLSQIKDILTFQQFQLYQQRREEKMGVPKEAQTYPKQSSQSPLNYQQSY
jgi:periplasmic protein CpxP/Spy